MPDALAFFEWDWFPSDWSMRTIYMLCAAVGGIVLILQTILLLFGFGDFDGDVDVDTGDIDAGDGSFSVLSVRAVFAFITVFGLSGWAALNAGWGELPSLATGLGAGFVVMLGVAWVMHQMFKFQSHGNIDPTSAIGKTANVYLRIPEKHSGKGKITVSLQGRSMEYEAVTSGPEIPTGGAVRIVSMPTAGTFEVKSLDAD